ncbi:HEPN domain-containing protein [Oceanimonas smirnovii]|uniref:DNA-binding protein n=1 Tax=Oceanimonas smirnovii TaxID=264574 RepID=UPI0011C040A7
MLTKIDLQRLAEARLEDSVFLLRANRASSAYYLAGYSVELGLKACISKLFQENVIPDKSLVNATYTHSLEALMSTSGLLPELKADMKAHPRFGANWGIATKWNEHSRYEFWDPISAATLITAISDNDHGVFPWVKKHW